MAIGWGYYSFALYTDSATVRNWIGNSMSEEKRLMTKGAAEMIIKRILGTLKSVLEEFQVDCNVHLIASDKNKADKRWLVMNNAVGDNVCYGAVSVKEVHDAHHFGVDRTLFLPRQLARNVSREIVDRVVRQCDRCQMKDPSPVRHKSEELPVAGLWQRIAVDIVHYRSKPYLSVVDCGPSRFAVWRGLSVETVDHVSRLLNELFLEQGPVRELLMDNATAGLPR